MTKLQEMLTDAHMSGQNNQGVDASWYEALCYVKNELKLSEEDCQMEMFMESTYENEYVEGLPKSVHEDLQQYLDASGDYTPSDKPRCYLAGPMRGYKNLNFEAFFSAEKRLKERGYLVINPARNPLGLSPDEYFEIDTFLLSYCDCIYMLVGWEESWGACIEHNEYLKLGLEVLYEEDEIKEYMNHEDCVCCEDCPVCVGQEHTLGLLKELFDAFEYSVRQNPELIEEPDPELLREIEELVGGLDTLEIKEDEDYQRNGFEGKTVFYIGDYPNYPLLISLGFDKVAWPFCELMDSPLEDIKNIQNADFVFRENGYQDNEYYNYLSDVAKINTKIILDE